MESQLARAKRIREDKDFTDFDALDTIVIGICGGDGIGPVITKESERVLSFRDRVRTKWPAARSSLRRSTA